MRKIATTLLIIGFTRVTTATIINIPADYTTIQQGIDASTDGDTVLVQPGTYYENINFNGHNVALGSLFLTTGDESYISSTVIDGDSSGAVISLLNFENSSSAITGFTIIHGGGVRGGGIICDGTNPNITHNHINGNFGEYGGGIYCNQAYPIISDNVINGNTASGIGCFWSWPKITNNTFMGNSSELGGAIYCENSPDAVISGNYISRNFGISDGAGIYCNTSDATIAGNVIGENIAGRGGGIFCQQSSPSIKGNTISGNLSEINGGGIYLFQSDPTIGNNIIEGNLSYSYGAGLFCNHSNPDFINNTVTGNTANIRGGGIYNFYSVPVITNSIFWANSAPSWPEIFNYSGSSAITYSDIQGGWPGEGNIDVNPLFCHPDNGDFHLMFTPCGDTLDSPCIDAGSSAIIDSLLDCGWGLGTIASDMGAYGGGDEEMLDVPDNEHLLPDDFAGIWNYPNPFNAVTTIGFTLTKESEVTLSVYNIIGQKVAELFEGIKRVGNHSIVWNAIDYPSGVYFARLEIEDCSRSKKMVLLK